MQLKSITLFAASLALAQAAGWGDENISTPVDGGVVSPPSSTPNVPVGGGDKPTPPVGGGDKPTPPVGGGDKPTPPVGGGDKPTPPVGGGDKPTPPVGGGDKPTPPTDKPTGKPTGGSTSVADETTDSKTWADESTIVDPSKTPVLGGTTSSSSTTTWADATISTPVADSTTTSFPTYWGDETDVADLTKTPVDGGETSSHTWADYGSSTTTTTPVKDTTTTSTTSSYYWGDYTPSSTPSAPVSGGQGKPPGKPDAPVSGGDGKPPGKPDAPVSGGNGQPPAGGAGGPPAGGAGGCGVVTVTQTNTVTVTAHPGKPAGPTAPPAPPAAPPVATETQDHTWADVPAPSSGKPVPTAPTSGGYMGIVEEWRAKLGLPDLEYDSQLQSNAENAAQSADGTLTHKLNPGSMAQVLAPGEDNTESFYKCFVGGWLCERPGLPGLDGVCSSASQGWDYAGQTGHADILISPKYTKIGCGCATGIWACDLA